jgi:hypothetical protein
MPTLEDVLKEDRQEFEKAIKEGLISQELRIPINLEEELDIAVSEAKYTLTLEDVRIYFRVAFRSFVAKAAVIEMLVSLFIVLVFNLIAPYLSPFFRNLASYGAVLLLIVLIVVVIVRANSGLLSLAKNLYRINALYKFRQKRRDVQLLAFSSDRKNLKELFEANAYHYGLALNSARAITNIDSKGAAKFENEIIINATRHGVQSIERFTNVFFDPYKEVPKVFLPSVKYNYSNNQIVFLSTDILQSRPKKIEWLLTANPEFPVDIPVPYKYKSELPEQAFSMTTSDLENSGNNLEWFSQHISYPTKILTMEVNFPKEYIPENIGIAVWNTPNVKHLNKIEYERLLRNNSMKLTENGGIVSIKLQVEYPITGVHYVITWLPMIEWSIRN